MLFLLNWSLLDERDAGVNLSSLSRNYTENHKVLIFKARWIFANCILTKSGHFRHNIIKNAKQIWLSCCGIGNIINFLLFILSFIIQCKAFA